MPPKVRQIGLPRFRIQNVQACHVHFLAFERFQRGRAAHRPADNRGGVFVPVKIFARQIDGRITTGHRNFPFDDLPLAQQPDEHPAIGLGRTGP